MGKYDSLTGTLRAAYARGQDTVELGFDEIEQLIGGRLPQSSTTRQWWANNSQVQALAWRSAEFHVEQVYLDRRRVRFARGKVGGSYADRGRVAANPSGRPLATLHAAAQVERSPIDSPIDVRVKLQWHDGGVVTLDSARKPTFASLEDTPGLYRMTLSSGLANPRRRVYVGETDSLRRRLSSNYRNPGPRQQTSLRINALLCDHLHAGGQVTLAIATSATVWLDGVEKPLNLTRKAGRLLAESAALVLAQDTDDADIVNLG